jgi:23S rRNA pseudouridine2605 synthase
LSERLQKVLAAAGVCSRREAETWISAKRVLVNGKVAKLGERVSAEAEIKVDGRRLRLERQAPEDLLVIYHRDPGEPLKRTADLPLTDTAVMERLPTVRNRRWLALAPLSPSDGGLEVFSTDGQLRAAVSRHAAQLVSGYALRLSGDWQHISAEQLKQTISDVAPFELIRWAQSESEGRNRWVECEVKGAHGRELRQLLTQQGFEVSRILRLSLGPLSLERGLSRRRSLEIKGKERAALYAAVGLMAPQAPSARELDAGSTRQAVAAKSLRHPRYPRPRRAQKNPA